MASWIKGKVDGAKKVVTDKVDDAKEAIAIKQAELEEKERVRKRLKWEKEREEAERIAEYEASKPRLPRDVAAAAEKGDVARVRRWFDEGGRSARGRTTSHGKSLLMLAAKRGQLEVMELAFAKGADANECDHKGSPALHYAVLYQRTPRPRCSSTGARVDQASYTLGMTATMYAAQYGDAETLRLLIDKGASWRAGRVWIAATTFASVGMSLHGQPKNGFTVVAAAFVVEGLHLAFNANPMLTSAMLLEKEKAKAAKSK
ncbi:hypothetical protein SO694_00078143 [Aureococcus anophagefferens]|uniref:Uncharacterized protein n=1 Tax=Aureococcus anophagefferens TaxID=44056 RepID=A0ABR1FH52_AURAN